MPARGEQVSENDGGPRGKPHTRVRGARRRRSGKNYCRRYVEALTRVIVVEGRRSINEVFGVNTRRPRFDKMDCASFTRSVKEWLGGPEVRRATRGKGRMEREGARQSFLMLKKAFPDACRCMTESCADEFRSRVVSRPSGELPHGFLEFVRREVEQMFSVGWDRRYEEYAAVNPVSTSACVEAGRKAGGARSQLSYENYSRVVMGSASVPLSPFRYSEVRTAGKLRPLTITPANMSYLRPLHKMMYDHLRRQKWLLVGSPSARKFERAGFRLDGVPLLSGDYQGATDNLDLRVSDTILAAILRRCRSVPWNVRSLAEESLYPEVQVGGETVRVTHGQMMGSLLSFPLLCLYNRLVSVWALGKCPMLVNGDDLVAETSSSERWFQTLPPLGMRPERTKTGLSSRVCDINSQRFCVRAGRLAEVPTIRTRVLVPKPQTALGMGSEMQQFCRTLSGSAKRRAAALFLRAKAKPLHRAIVAGLHPASLGFRGLEQYQALAESGWVRLFMKVGRTAPRIIPPPPLFPDRLPVPTIPHHGPLSRELSVFNRSELLEQQFGVDTKPAGRRAVADWWKRVEETRFKTPSWSPSFVKVTDAPVGRRFVTVCLPGSSESRVFFRGKVEASAKIPELGIKTVRRSFHWGELCPRNKALARFKNLMTSVRTSNVARVCATLTPLTTFAGRHALHGMLWIRGGVEG